MLYSGETSISPKEYNREFENLDRAIDFKRNLDYQDKIERYELNEALVLLINEIFPDPSIEDFNIKDRTGL